MSKNSGRGLAFTRSEMEYIVAKCLRAMVTGEKIRDTNIAKVLDRGKNNISILRRNLGFTYKQDSSTGEIKIYYKKPNKAEFRINIERLDPNKAIASAEYKYARKVLLKEGRDPDSIKIDDFYPDVKIEKVSKEILSQFGITDEGIFLDKKEKEKREYEEYEEEEEEYFTADRFSDHRNDERHKKEEDNIEEEEAETVVVSSIGDKTEEQSKEEKVVVDDIISKPPEEVDYSIYNFDSAGFASVRLSLSDDEWEFFKSRWAIYTQTYEDQFNMAEDFDDLSGLISELIKRNRLLRREREEFDSYDRELTESSRRYEIYKSNLATSRKSRITRNVDERYNIADIVEKFESNEQYMELVVQAEQDIENMIDWAKKNDLFNPTEKFTLDKVHGNEEFLLAGLDLSKLKKMLTVQR